MGFNFNQYATLLRIIIRWSIWNKQTDFIYYLSDIIIYSTEFLATPLILYTANRIFNVSCLLGDLSVQKFTSTIWQKRKRRILRVNFISQKMQQTRAFSTFWNHFCVGIYSRSIVYNFSLPLHLKVERGFVKL